MLHDKTRVAPSLEGFGAFVKAKCLTNPAGRYSWSFPESCAVGQYLRSRDWYEGRDWYSKRDGLLDQMDTLARGAVRLGMRPRDGHGQFISVRSQWTWKALSERIEKALVCE